MPVPDDEPQYWLRDSSGNLIGSFYLNSNDNPAIIEQNGNEAVLEPDGTWSTPGISTSDLSGSYPTRVRAFDSTGVVASIDPSTTTTPVQDAIDAIGATNAGTVRLPPGKVTEAAPLKRGYAKQILGHGEWMGSIIEFSNPADGAIRTDESIVDWRSSYIDGVNFLAAGGSNTATAVRFTNTNVPGFNLGLVRFNGWGDPCMEFGKTSTLGHPFNFVWDHVEFRGQTGTAMRWMGGGPNGVINSIHHRGDSASGSESETIYTDPAGGPQVVIGCIETLANIERQIDARGGPMQIGGLHFERDDGGASIESVRTQDVRLLGIGYTQVTGMTVDQVYNLALANADNILGPAALSNATVNNTVVNITSQPTAASWYFGPASSITNSAGTSTGLVRSLATAGTGNG